MFTDKDVPNEIVTNPSLLQKITDQLSSLYVPTGTSQDSVTFSGASSLIRGLKLIGKRFNKHSESEDDDDDDSDDADDSDGSESYSDDNLGPCGLKESHEDEDDDNHGDDSSGGDSSGGDSSDVVSIGGESSDAVSSFCASSDGGGDECSSDDACMSVHLANSSSESDSDSYPVPDPKSLSFSLRTHSINSRLKRQISKMSSFKAVNRRDNNCKITSEPVTFKSTSNDDDPHDFDFLGSEHFVESRYRDTSKVVYEDWKSNSEGIERKHTDCNYTMDQSDCKPM